MLDPLDRQERELDADPSRDRRPAVEARWSDAGGSKVAYVRLLAFSDGAHAELREEVERLDEQGAEGLVLDLRGNGGGLLTEAVLTSSVFVEDGVIVSTEGRTQATPDLRGRRRRAAAAPDGGADQRRHRLGLRDPHRGARATPASPTVVGETSFGKGIFQEVIQLDNGGALDLTVGEYLTRDGDSLDGVGIKPEVRARDAPPPRPTRACSGRSRGAPAVARRRQGPEAGVDR